MFIHTNRISGESALIRNFLHNGREGINRSGAWGLWIITYDQNSNMPFLRNEFSKIFEDIFTMMYFTEMNDPETKFFEKNSIINLENL